MLQFPYAIYPQGQSLDGTMENIFSCIISGTICTAYQIKIYENNTNTVVYQGVKTDVEIYNQEMLIMDIPANSFNNGGDYIWSARLWTNNYDMKVASNTIIEIINTKSFKIEPYTITRILAGQKVIINNVSYTINSYTLSEDGSYGIITTSENLSGVVKGTMFTIYSNFIDTPTSYFKGRSTPIVSISNMQSEINSRRYEFKGEYMQNENVPIQYYVFELYDEKQNLIDVTENIYSANIKYFYEGFINDSKYYISLICVNQDNIEVSTLKQEFSIKYDQADLGVGLEAKLIPEKNSIRLFVVPDKTSVPKFNGEYKIVQNYPFIDTNSAEIKKDKLIYDNVSEKPLDIKDNSFTIFTSTRLNKGFQGKIIELDGDENRYIELDNYTFYDVKNNVRTKIKDIYNINKFLLQPEFENNVGYIWDNSAIWDNSYKWFFSSPSIDTKQIKITILPTTSSITEVEYE